jgi:hypothetical protein
MVAMPETQSQNTWPASNFGFRRVGQIVSGLSTEIKAIGDTPADKDTPSNAREILGRYLPEVRSCHDLMRSRKLALKKAA